MSKKTAHQNIDWGIHVRHAPWGNGVKKNTCALIRERANGKLPKRLRKVKENLERRRVSHASTLKALPATVNPLSFRQPGSMKGF